MAERVFRRVSIVQLKYVGQRLFEAAMAPFAKRMRRRRMRVCERVMALDGGPRILDLGGKAAIWDDVAGSLDITIVNLPGARHVAKPTHHRIRYVEGDACRVEQFADGAFDVVFSNSVIEHVGPGPRIAEFANEVRRLGRSYWVQTPCQWFPIEAHCGMPFWWFYPEALRRHFLSRWRRKLPGWTKMIEETRVLSRRQLEHLFPGAEAHVERFLGIPKSYAVFVRPPR